MFKAVKEYWVEVMVPAFKWLRRHWLGYAVFCVVLMLGEFAGIYALNARKQREDFKELKEYFEEGEES